LLTAPIHLSSLLQTEVRAQKYQASCVREMVELCGVVCERGYTDPAGRQAIRFADLFNSYRWPTKYLYKQSITVCVPSSE
jgi:hypothetical protein